MKLLKVLLCPIILFMLTTACRDKHSFIIDGRVDNAGKITKIYLLEADGAEMKVVDSTNIGENASFQFLGKTAYPNLYRLSIGEQFYSLIIQNGDVIQFSADIKNRKKPIEITGSPASLQLQKWDQLNDAYARESQELTERYQKELLAPKANKDSLLKVYTPVYQRITDELSRKTWQFVNDNKNSMVAFYEAISLDRRQFESQLIAYAESISNNLKENPAVATFVKEMEMIKPVSLGQKAPFFTTMNTQGKSVSLSDVKGKLIMLDFWASWCPPCRRENPNVVKLYHRYHSNGFQIFGISLDEDKYDWQKAIKADKLDWPQASDQQRFDGTVERLYHIDEIPSNFIIDEQGIIVGKNLFGADLEKFLARKFSKLRN